MVRFTSANETKISFSEEAATSESYLFQKVFRQEKSHYGRHLTGIYERRKTGLLHPNNAQHKRVLQEKSLPDKHKREATFAYLLKKP